MNAEERWWSTKAKHYGSDEIDAIIKARTETFKESFTQGVSEKISELIVTSSFLDLDMFANEQIPMAVLRLETVHAIFDGFRQLINDDAKYISQMRLIGGRIGMSFAIDLIHFLNQVEGFPEDYAILYNSWIRHEFAGRWGRIEIPSIDPKGRLPQTVDIHIFDDFLAKGYLPDENPYRHGSFWEGYLRCAIDELFLQWTRWFEVRHPRYVIPYLEVVEVTEKEAGHEAHAFTLVVDAERLPRTRDKLAKSMEFFHAGNYQGSTGGMREALEVALPEKVGLYKRDDQRVLWSDLLKVYRECVPDFPASKSDRLFGRLSVYVHSPGRSLKDMMLTQLYHDVRQSIWDIQSLGIKDTDKERIIASKGRFFQHGQQTR